MPKLNSASFGLNSKTFWPQLIRKRMILKQMKSVVILYFIKIYVNHINSLIELNEMEFQIIFYENL